MAYTTRVNAQPVIDVWSHPQSWTPVEFINLRERTERRMELVEGALLMVPSPDLLHQTLARELLIAFYNSLPPELNVVAELDVRLGSEFRLPDLVVYNRSAVSKTAKNLLPDQVALVVEVVSPSSQRRDYLAKMHDYAQAGIPYYWIVDRCEDTTVSCYRNTPSHTYAQYASAAGTETLVVSEPFSFSVVPAALAR